MLIGFRGNYLVMGEDGVVFNTLGWYYYASLSEVTRLPFVANRDKRGFLARKDEQTLLQ